MTLFLLLFQIVDDTINNNYDVCYVNLLELADDDKELTEFYIMTLVFNSYNYLYCGDLLMIVNLLELADDDKELTELAESRP